MNDGKTSRYPPNAQAQEAKGVRPSCQPRRHHTHRRADAITPPAWRKGPQKNFLILCVQWKKILLLSCGAGNFNFSGKDARATLTLDAQTVGVIRLPCRWARGRRELTGGRKAASIKELGSENDGTAARKAWAAVPVGSFTGSVFFVADNFCGLMKGRQANQPSSQS